MKGCFVNAISSNVPTIPEAMWLLLQIVTSFKKRPNSQAKFAVWLKHENNCRNAIGQNDWGSGIRPIRGIHVFQGEGVAYENSGREESIKREMKSSWWKSPNWLGRGGGKDIDLVRGNWYILQSCRKKITEWYKFHKIPDSPMPRSHSRPYDWRLLLHPMEGQENRWRLEIWAESWKTTACWKEDGNHQAEQG